MKSLRLFIADDHGLIREGLRVLLNAQAGMEVVGEANNGRDAYAAIDALRPDVVLMDVCMPQLDGIQVTKRIKRSSPLVRVLALSAYEGSSLVRQMLQEGASGYVLKGAVIEELV